MTELAALLFGRGTVVTGPTSASSSEPITVTAGGEVLFASSNLLGSISGGDNWSISYTFEPTQVDRLPSDPQVGVYTTGKVYGVIGSYAFSGTDFEIGVQDARADRYTVVGLAGDLSAPPLVPGALEAVSIDLTDPTGRVFSSDTVPLVLDLADFDPSSQLAINWGSIPNLGVVRGNITSLSVEPSPVMG
jgi:hypothetical protein